VFTPRARRSARSRPEAVDRVRVRAAARLTGRRALATVARLPLALRLVAAAVVVVAVWWGVNWAYQVARKPAELFFPVSGGLAKTPPQTWQRYERLFRRYSTDVITPELLAALAQVESSGNPLARTYWRWRATWNPFDIYRPASSAVGMFQMTDATFREARRYCIRGNRVVEVGPWHDLRACWFPWLSTRTVPGHAVQLTAAHLDRAVDRTLRQQRIGAATPPQPRRLAAVIHLCGAGAGTAYARRGFRPTPGQRCGDHDLARYLARVEAMKRQFARLADGE
jgi:hypothetical protein